MTFQNAYIVLRRLSTDNRRVASLGRTMLALKEKYSLAQLDRQARQTLRFMEQSGLVKPIEGARGFFLVTAPYVASKEVNPYELLMEAYYDSTLAYSTAMELHQLTDQRFRLLHVLTPEARDENTRLLDTPVLEWDPLLFRAPSRIKEFEDYTVSPHRSKAEWAFGNEIVKPEGFSIRVTDLERTLLDGLRYPKHCGGLDEVFRAWVRAYDLLDEDKLVAYAEQFDIGVLYQRLGFVLDTIGIKHRRLEKWHAEHAQRGGSRVLNPEAPFSGERFDERWALSINHPVSILETMDASYS